MFIKFHIQLNVDMLINFGVNCPTDDTMLYFLVFTRISWKSRTNSQTFIKFHILLDRNWLVLVKFYCKSWKSCYGIFAPIFAITRSLKTNSGDFFKLHILLTFYINISLLELAVYCPYVSLCRLSTSNFYLMTIWMQRWKSFKIKIVTKL